MVRISLSKEDITRLFVGGFKSISQVQSIEIKPLTLLAGANSSGKSSLMQALLLLKQTLEAPYDPGALLLQGPNVKFTSAEQLLSRNGYGRSFETFHVGIEIQVGSAKITHFKLNTRKRLDVEETTYNKLRLYKGMSKEEIQAVYERAYRKVGSGSHEHGSPFQVVAMEKEAQTNLMHHPRFGERERFPNKPSQTLREPCSSSARHELSHRFPCPLRYAAPRRMTD